MFSSIYLVQFTLALITLSVYTDSEQCIINSENNLTIGQSWSEYLANWAICCKGNEQTTVIVASDVNSNSDDLHSSGADWTTESPKSQPEPEGPEHYASSVPYLISLARSEMEIYRELKDYADALEERLKLIKIYMRDYEDSTIKGTEQLDPDIDPWFKASHAAANPLIAYRSVRRLSHSFRDIFEHIGLNYEKRLEDVVAYLEGVSGWPAKEDKEDRMEAILRLHYSYNLNLEEFTNGIIGGVDTNVRLPTHQIFEIAEFAIQEKYYSLVPDWLHLTESRITKEDGRGVTMEQVENAYQKNTELHDQNFKSLWGQGHKYLFSKPLVESVDTGIKTMREFGMTLVGMYTGGLALAQYPEETTEFLRRYDLNHYISMDLCSGKYYQTEAYKSYLTCWYDTSRSHYFGHINPLKVEILNYDPLLIQFYDVIGDTWIDDLVEKSYTKLRREDPLVLGRSASDSLQITSYPTGGHVGLHYDSFGLNSSMPRFYESGDRITTFLIYLNDFGQGGYTSFPVLRTHVKPVKGSAVLYYISLKNGDKDDRLMHEACPVILGHKWIASKSTYLNANFLKRPCDLNPNV